ncbi:MAG: efflux RND transporter periplasmic adaptor subunit [Polaromonas sp.]|nr:efflux RND transporter periplasmic adaptor subunit [Polaromonas sp.]
MVEGNELKIYLDRYATNEPVTDAKIEVEIGNIKGVAAAQADGSYSFKSDVFAKPGDLAVSFTVLAGKDADLLAGDLKIGNPADDHAHHKAAKPWLRWAAYAGGALLLAAIAIVVLRRRKNDSSFVSNATLLIAACVLIVSATAPFDTHAGPGHDHGDAAPAATTNAPKRQADGSVFLPKISQRQLGIRTMAVEEASLPKAIELTGRVIADANAGGKVQPTQAGRVEAGPRGLPMLGQTVRKGEVLAVVRASSGAIERANQQSQSTELKSNLKLAEKRLARLEQLEGTVPAKDIEAAKLDVASLQQRSASVSASVVALEALVAPVSGVIAAANVALGQVVDAREVLFEIVDPTRLNVEASAFDAALLANIASASASPSTGINVPLTFVGAGRALREGAIPVLFKIAAAKDGKTNAVMAVGQPIKVLVQTKEQIKGFAVPAGAVVKNPNNQDMVWVHTGAEMFAPRPVRVVALDGATVSVIDGLKASDRVVTQGAPLVNQVR